MPNSNGRIYTEIRDGVKYGISTDDVAYVLGVNTGDIATLCLGNVRPANKISFESKFESGWYYRIVADLPVSSDIYANYDNGYVSAVFPLSAGDSNGTWVACNPEDSEPPSYENTTLNITADKSYLYYIDGDAVPSGPEIKKYSKYKPYYLGGVGGYSPELAKACDYGLYIPYYTSLKLMVQDIRSGQWTHAVNYDANKTPWNWEFAKLTGRDGEYYRLGDFDGYNHNSQCAIGTITSGSSYLPLGQYPEFIVPHIVNEGQMGLADYIQHSIGIVPGQMSCGLMVTCDNNMAPYGFNRATYLIDKNVARANEGPSSDFYYQANFALYRGLYSSMNNIRAMYFLSSVTGGSVPSVSGDITKTGYFVPIIPSLTDERGLNIQLEGMSYQSGCDSVSPYIPYNNDYSSVIWVKPNYSYKFKFHVEASLNPYITGQYFGDPLTTEVEFPIYAVWDDYGEQCDMFIKIQTNWSARTATIKLFNSSAYPGLTINDVYAETYDGQPIVAEQTHTASIVNGIADLNYVGQTSDNVGYYTHKYPIDINGVSYNQNYGDAVMFVGDGKYYAWYIGSGNPGEWVEINGILLNGWASSIEAVIYDGTYGLDEQGYNRFVVTAEPPRQ